MSIYVQTSRYATYLYVFILKVFCNFTFILLSLAVKLLNEKYQRLI